MNQSGLRCVGIVYTWKHPLSISQALPAMLQILIIYTFSQEKTRRTAPGQKTETINTYEYK